MDSTALNSPTNATVDLIDTHCHLTYPALYDQLDKVLHRARVAGVSRMITIATDVTDARRALALTNHYHDLFASVGVHPHEANKCTPRDIDALRELRHHPRTVAWGEIGLDYHYDFSDRASQRTVFEQQLKLIARCGLPIVVHCREAASDCFEILSAHGFENHRVVFHCFTGTAQEAEQIINRGWWMSFTGIATFKNSGWLRDIAKDYPLEQLMLETDAPYLSPVPHRNQRPNEPSLVVHTASCLAKVKSIDLVDLARQTTRNAESFFNLD